ncbi:MAG: AAA family ATPase [Chitinivibrionales bacterium]|nr:AAA family ATPase [Chitinivibrionales bacterium]
MPRRTRQTLVMADSDVGGTIHVANIKGGVGKSTVATNLASALAKRGRTLVIDLDVQGSATVAFGRDVGRNQFSSWELLRKRFARKEQCTTNRGGALGDVVDCCRRMESAAFGWVIGQGRIPAVVLHIDKNLDLIPAGPELFKPVRPYHVNTLIYNLAICRESYKYVVIDTPSVWNELIRALYIASDLNLVPVTLNALSTKSLREYLHNVKLLAQSKRSVRVRIVKNEVFGKAGGKLRGKTRTMNENRVFLERLCEQVVLEHKGGLSIVPQSILLDLEIPETAVVRDAQDEGVTVERLHQYSAVTKAFGALASELQHVLNNYAKRDKPSFWKRFEGEMSLGAKVAALLVLAVLFSRERPAIGFEVPRPIAPQQVVESPERVLTCTLERGQSLYRLAKYAICRFRAKVPSMAELDQYTLETIRTHNRTRRPGEQKIADPEDLPAGTELRFYPPTRIKNPYERQMVPVYEYFCALVEDQYSYITGDWCERGEGGGTPHYGIDVAGAYGTKIYSPIDGTAVVHYSASFGRTLGVITGNSIVFFSHLGDIAFSTGDRVKQGAAVGTIGMTGRTSGPHVHIGYGVRTFTGSGTRIGKRRYRLTDPKLFFYREVFFGGLENSQAPR